MEDLIFISQRIPYPPNKGDKLRSWNALKKLSEHYRIHLGSFVDDSSDWKHEEYIREICETYRLLPLNKLLAQVRSLRGFLLGDALTVPYFYDARLRKWLDSVRRDYNPTRAFTFSSGVAGYLMGSEWKSLWRVHDMVDIDSDKWVQYAASKRGIGKWVYHREGRKLQDFEGKVVREYDITLFVSEYEADLFRDFWPRESSKVYAVRNGVDTTYFDPVFSFENPYEASIEPIVITGTMDYWPNVDAAQWYVERVFPKVRETNPKAVFFVVGANPTFEISSLGKKEGVVVTGRVDDVRPYIAHAKVVVAPLRIARGVQNKVLEGMAMARPVVVSPMALEGIEATPGEEVILAEGPDEFAEATTAILGGERLDIGEKARKRVISDYSWDKNFEKLLDYVAGEV